MIGTAGTERGSKLVLGEGPTTFWTTRPRATSRRCPSLTGGKGPDIILEMLANVNLQKDLGVIGMNGRIVVIGNRGEIEINARLAMNKNADILGMALSTPRRRSSPASTPALVEGLPTARCAR